MSIDAKSLDGLKPVRAGRFVVHGSHDRDKICPSDIAIEIDAGRAFGTGHHGTTAGCLETIETVMRSRRVRNALDLGTGSGVLAIAVRKLKNNPGAATDIDDAVRVHAKTSAAWYRLGSASRLLRDFIRPLAARTVRSRHRQYSGAAAYPHGAATGRTSGAGRLGHSFGHPCLAALEGDCRL